MTEETLELIIRRSRLELRALSYAISQKRDVLNDKQDTMYKYGATLDFLDECEELSESEKIRIAKNILNEIIKTMKNI